MTEYKQSIVDIAEICAQHGIENAILAPGSRSAPLTLAFARHPKMTCRVIVDERSAGFIALGLAQQTGKPAVVICTSGTSVLNLAPAVAEAYYQRIPLLLLTADRPAEWIDQNDGQALPQANIFGRLCRGAFELPVDDSHPDAKWHVVRVVSEAVNRCQTPIPGPVQVNVPLREPLYPESDFRYSPQLKKICIARQENKIADWSEIDAVWRSCEKKLIIIGMASPNPELKKSLAELQDTGIPILCDITSNQSWVSGLNNYDVILWSGHEKTLSALKPDLLVSAGGPVVSKNLKLYLRRFKPQHHWHVQEDTEVADTFQSLTQIIPTTPVAFFRHVASVSADSPGSDNTYYQIWSGLNSKAQKKWLSFFKEAGFCELAAMRIILEEIPQSSLLQLGNSSIVRWASYVGRESVGINSNRGASGIDGTVSTAVGAALSTNRLTTLIVGDLAFFYDRNALWNRFVPSNLRVVVFNNDGGGIFRILDGSREQPEMEDFFEVGHGLTAEPTARQHGLGYESCDSQAKLTEVLPSFFEPAEQPKLLELFFDKKSNADAFFHFKALMREIK